MSNEAWEFIHPATGCARCPELARTRHTIVWGKGPSPADIMMIGEAPGYNEDQRGIPFIGRAGKQMHKILKEALEGTGVKPADVHIANRIMCRPPGNRDPTPEEMSNCNPWLTQHIREVNPKGVVLFGRSAISYRFDRMTVADTQGLMYVTECDACGQPVAQHGRRYAKDGQWNLWSNDCLGETMVKTRVYAAIYHPAATLGHRNPEYIPHIVRDLRRLAEEIKQL